VPVLKPANQLLLMEANLFTDTGVDERGEDE